MVQSRPLCPICRPWFDVIVQFTSPTLIEIKTVIGYGSPKKQGTKYAHGEPLGAEEAILTKQVYGWDYDEFFVPGDVQENFKKCIVLGEKAEEKWNELFRQYKNSFPNEAQQFEDALQGRVWVPWDEVLPDFQDSIATRDAFGKIVNAIAQYVPTLVGGSADLSSSNKTIINGEEPFCANSYAGTFFVFSDYLKPALRLAALMKQPAIHIFTHDSIAVGEDGPTHEPIEQLPSLRSIPGFKVFRPADATETAMCFRYALEHREGPVALVLTRQKVPTLNEIKAHAADVYRGGYVLYQNGDGRDLILLATGSEVQLVLKAAQQLAEEGIAVRVVNLPCMELFDQQDLSYRESVLPSSVMKRLAVEMAHPMSWYKYVGRAGRVLGIDQFGISAPGDMITRTFGFTVENVLMIAKQVLQSGLLGVL